MSVVNVVCCPVDVSAKGRFLVQSSPTACGVSVCNLKTLTTRLPRTEWDYCATKKYPEDGGKKFSQNVGKHAKQDHNAKLTAVPDNLDQSVALLICNGA